MAHKNIGNRQEAVIDIVKPISFTGGLEFSSLTYTVTKSQKLEGKWIKQKVDLLNRITGYAPKGCITAVMGPSGARKSTLLDGLAGRTLVYRCVRDRFLTFAWFYDDSKVFEWFTEE
ncbi:hypothetical protein D5086_014437 [Populus alba]|uniref:Uncharacterized protein n=1 Tax=Populus alba TaxID=43335 RepID=A0ACC4BY86_POPAL